MKGLQAARSSPKDERASILPAEGVEVDTNPGVLGSPSGTGSMPTGLALREPGQRDLRRDQERQLAGVRLDEQHPAEVVAEPKFAPVLEHRPT